MELKLDIWRLKNILASTMKKIERRLISVVSGFDNKNSRSKDSRKLLN